MNNLTLIIPAKKEAESLPVFLKELEQYNCEKIIVLQKDDIESNLPEWALIKHIPNKFPQLKLGQNNDKTSTSDFYIYKK